MGMLKYALAGAVKGGADTYMTLSEEQRKKQEKIDAEKRIEEAAIRAEDRGEARSIAKEGRDLQTTIDTEMRGEGANIRQQDRDVNIKKDEESRAAEQKKEEEERSNKQARDLERMRDRFRRAAATQLAKTNEKQSKDDYQREQSSVAYKPGDQVYDMTGEEPEHKVTIPNKPAKGSPSTSSYYGYKDQAQLGKNITAHVKTFNSYGDKGFDDENTEARYVKDSAKIERVIKDSYDNPKSEYGKNLSIEQATELVIGKAEDLQDTQNRRDRWSAMAKKYGKNTANDKATYLSTDNDDFKDSGGKRGVYAEKEAQQWLKNQEAIWNKAKAAIEKNPDSRLKVIREVTNKGYDVTDL